MAADTEKTFGEGRYQVLELLGQGGMGSVYKALDTIMSRQVAIKTIRTEGLAPEDVNSFRRAFQAEAQGAGRLDHGGIVTVFDFNPVADEPYLVMALMEGGTLADMLSWRGRLPEEDILDLGIQVAEALDYAHQHGVKAHRDIKPGNIFLTAEGRYKVGDFGIAHVRRTVSDVTHTTMIAVGTPRYMAPEQASSPRDVDGRADLFALCVVLYKSLTGEFPYEGVRLDFDPEEKPDLARQIVAATFNKRASLRNRMPELSTALADAIDRGLHPDRAQRYRSCGEFAAVLRRLAGMPASAEAVAAPVQESGGLKFSPPEPTPSGRATPVTPPTPLSGPTPITPPTPLSRPTPPASLTPVSWPTPVTPTPVTPPTPVSRATPMTPVSRSTPVTPPTPANRSFPANMRPDDETVPEENRTVTYVLVAVLSVLIVAMWVLWPQKG